jgi:DNA-binding transcriptional LysR family regulator
MRRHQITLTSSKQPGGIDNLSDWANLRDLETLVAVVEERKTTAAAIRLGISQPAVSRSISQLEKRLNVTLFQHQGGGLTPTAHALAMHEKLVPILHAIHSLRAQSNESPASSTLRITTSPTLAHGFLERCINDFLQKNPQINVSLEITTTPEVLELVADQRADIGVADVIGLSAGLTRLPFRSGFIVCAVPRGHVLANQTVISPKDLHEQSVILLAKRNAMRPTLDRIFTKATSRPRVVLETSTTVSAMHFVSLGLGVALLHSYPSSEYYPSNVQLIEFSVRLPYELSFFIDRTNVPSLISQQFMDFVRSQQPKRSYQSEIIKK